MVVVPVFDSKKVGTVRTGMVFVHADDNQAIAMQDEVLDVKMVAEINGLQHVATSFDLVIIDEKDEKEVLSEVVLEIP